MTIDRTICLKNGSKEVMVTIKIIGVGTVSECHPSQSVTRLIYGDKEQNSKPVH